MFAVEANKIPSLPAVVDSLMNRIKSDCAACRFAGLPGAQTPIESMIVCPANDPLEFIDPTQMPTPIDGEWAEIVSLGRRQAHEKQRDVTVALSLRSKRSKGNFRESFPPGHWMRYSEAAFRLTESLE